MPMSVLAARSWNPPGPAPREHLAYISDDEARMIDTGLPGPTYRVSNGRRITDMPMNSMRPRNPLRQMTQQNWLAQRPQRGEDQGQFRTAMQGWIGARPFGGGGAGHIPRGGGDHPGAFPFPGGAEGGFPGDFPFPGGAGRDMGGAGGGGGGGFPGSMPPGWDGEARGYGRYSGRQQTRGGGENRGIPSFAGDGSMGMAYGGAGGYGGPFAQSSMNQTQANQSQSGSGYGGARSTGAYGSFGAYGSGRGTPGSPGFDAYGNRVVGTTIGGMVPGVTYSLGTNWVDPRTEPRPTQNMPKPTPEQLEDASAPTPGYYNSMQPRLSWSQAQRAKIGTITTNSRGQTIQKTAGGWAIIGNTGQRYAHQGAMRPVPKDQSRLPGSRSESFGTQSGGYPTSTGYQSSSPSPYAGGTPFGPRATSPISPSFPGGQSMGGGYPSAGYGGVPGLGFSQGADYSFTGR